MRLLSNKKVAQGPANTYYLPFYLNIKVEIRNTRARLRVNIHTKITVTVHNFHQFEKVEWKKLVRTPRNKI